MQPPAIYPASSVPFILGSLVFLASNRLATGEPSERSKGIQLIEFPDDQQGGDIRFPSDRHDDREGSRSARQDDRKDRQAGSACDPHYDDCVPDLNPNPHPCTRECRVGESLTCYYKMQIEWYSVLGKACFNCPLNMTDCYSKHCIPGDGVERGIITVNRQLPGIPISVCRGDKVVVDVLNKLPSETTTVHWHGQYMHGEIEGQEDNSIGDFGLRTPRNRRTLNKKVVNKTPWSDGVPGLTQCPILPGQSFRYKFIANPGGTHWYHAHAAFQREDGLYGKLVVRVPKEENVHRDLYCHDLEEHTIIFQDWVHKTGLSMFIPHHWDDGSNKADSFLINGRGRFRNFGINKIPGLYTPVAEFSVEEGKRYRFRLINAGVSMCPVEFSVEGHELTVIATDGIDIKPVKTASLVSHNGERYDVIIDTREMKKKTYKIKFGGLADCGANKVHGTALLKYKGSEEEDVFNGPTKYGDYINTKGRQVNAMNVNAGYNKNKINIAELRSADKEMTMNTEKADRTIYLGYSFYDLNNPEFHGETKYTFEDVIGKNKLRTPQINNITLTTPVSPLLTQFTELDPNMICNSATLNQKKHCKGGFCHCYHIEKIELGDTVDMFLIDEGLPWDVTHPFHLHGMHFQVLAQERFAEVPSHIFGASPPGNNIRKDFVVRRNEDGKIPRNFESPVLKDTVMVPDSGYTLVRFEALNPGFWFLHCHMSWHNHVGMGVIIQIGESFQMPKAPENFPKCGNFM